MDLWPQQRAGQDCDGGGDGDDVGYCDDGDDGDGGDDGADGADGEAESGFLSPSHPSHAGWSSSLCSFRELGNCRSSLRPCKFQSDFSILGSF